MRRAVELGIFQVLEDALQKAPTNNHYDLLSQLYAPPTELRVISLNHDLTIDTAMMYYSRTDRGPRLPEAALTSGYASRIPRLLKLKVGLSRN